MSLDPDEGRWHAEFEHVGIHEVQAHIDRGEYVTGTSSGRFGLRLLLSLSVSLA
jgi:hypothetical protein